MSTFIIRMRTSGAVDDAITEYAEGLFPASTSDDDEREYIAKCEELSELCSKWFKYGEYVRLRVNVGAKTIEVVPCDE